MTLSEGDRAKMAAARQLIQERRYDEARSLLSGIRHAKAHEWLEQLNRIAPVQYAPPPLPQQNYGYTPQYAPPPQSFTTKLVVSVVLLFVGIVPGLIALTIFSREAKNAQAQTYEELPGVRGLILLNRIVFGLLLLVLAFLVLSMLLPLVSYYLR